MSYLALFALVLGVNLLPAFGPPTWSLLVFARLRWHLEPVALVVLGVGAATLGRTVLALLARRFRRLVPRRATLNLEAARAALARHRGGAWAAGALFLLSPLPSAQLFLGAGLLEVRLAPLAGAFALGRVVSYSLYVTTAVVVDRNLGGVLAGVWGSPWSVAIQVAMLVALCALPLIPWRGSRRGAPDVLSAGHPGGVGDGHQGEQEDPGDDGVHLG